MKFDENKFREELKRRLPTMKESEIDLWILGGKKGFEEAKKIMLAKIKERKTAVLNKTPMSANQVNKLLVIQEVSCLEWLEGELE